MAKERYKVTTQGLNYRNEPSIRGEIIEALSKGDVVDIVSISG